MISKNCSFEHICINLSPNKFLIFPALTTLENSFKIPAQKVAIQSLTKSFNFDGFNLFDCFFYKDCSSRIDGQANRMGIVSKFPFFRRGGRQSLTGKSFYMTSGDYWLLRRQRNKYNRPDCCSSHP